MSSQRLLIRNGFVVSMDPDVGDIPNGDVLVEDGEIVEIGTGLEVSRRRGDRRDRDDRHAGLRRHPPAHLADAGPRRPPVLHARPLLRGHARQVGGHYRPEDVHIGDYAGSLEALNAGVTTLLDWSHISNTPDHSDAAIQGLKDAGHPRRLRARHADRRRVVVVQRARAPGGHPPHPRHVLLVRRRPAHARDGGAPARQLELRRREARLGARARARDPDQRARRHAAPQRCTTRP